MQLNFFGTELPSIVEGIKGVTKGMVTFSTFKSLMTFGSTAMFRSLEITAESTFHRFRSQCLVGACSWSNYNFANIYIIRLGNRKHNRTGDRLRRNSYFPIFFILFLAVSSKLLYVGATPVQLPQCYQPLSCS